MIISEIGLASQAALVRVDTIVGRATEDDWPDLLADAQVDVLHLDQAEAQKSRLRKATDAGVEIAISLDRGTQLRDGDILLWDAARHAAIVVRIELKDVLIIELCAVPDGPQEVSMARCFELGHALGNQHWAAVIKGTRVFVPLTVARTVMASVMRTHSFDGISYEFVPGADVIAQLAPHEARRLFGAGEGHRHLPEPESPGAIP